MTTENEKKAFAFLDKIVKRINSIPSNERQVNEPYFRFVFDYLQMLVKVGKQDGTFYVADCQKLAEILTDGPVNGYNYSMEDKIAKAINFIKQKIVEDSIEDLIVEWDRHTMYDVLTYPIL